MSEAKLSLAHFDATVTLGTGSFGRVKLAKVKGSNDDNEVPRIVAIKMLKMKEVIRLQQVEHMLAEKNILRDITVGDSSGSGLKSHPFIVKLFGTFQDEKYLYMVLEYINGGEFFTHLRKEGRLQDSAAKFYAASVCSIFEHLHGQDVIYRDLKPENLLLDSTGYLKITDFGFAKVVQFKTYTLCGTPEYIAPEVLLNKGHGKGVDWWTLGILIFEMLAGQPPFVDDDPMGIYQQILTGKISFPRFFDRQVKALIKKLLTADLTKRYGCMKGGAKDIKTHKWFKSLTSTSGSKVSDVFGAIIARSIPAPIVPKVSGADDTTNFDAYPESANEAEQATGTDIANFTTFDWKHPCMAALV